MPLVDSTFTSVKNYPWIPFVASRDFSCTYTFRQKNRVVAAKQIPKPLLLKQFELEFSLLPMGATTTDLAVELPRPTTVKEIRTGKLVAFGPVKSGIDKSCRDGMLFVSSLGLPDDEHDLTFHGGIDKAIHQYCSSHYPLWHEMYPQEEQIKRFVPGGFGENIVADEMNERNICVGDLVRIGPRGSHSTGGENGCLLEVSLPRQPCFKLNQRFGIKNFAPKTYQAAMTGWYYRVKEEGWIKPGMEIRVVERKFPHWTIAQLHHYVHREKKYTPSMQELIAMEELGNECRNVFVDRWQKHQEEESRLLAPKTTWREFRLVEKSFETPRIVRLTFDAICESKNPGRILPGSNIVIKLPNGLQRAYSVVSGNTDHFTLGVARDENSRGGSVYLHDSAQINSILEVGAISQNLAANSMASHHIFIVGGIGITAFLAMIERLKQTNRTFELHNCIRSSEDVAFSRELDEHKSNVKTYNRSKGERLDIEKMLKGRIWNSHVYICGPQRMIDGTLEAASKLGIPEEEIHYEQFKVDQTGDPFSIEVQSGSGCRSLQVSERQSLLEVMKEAGFEVPSSCETGSCGTCRIPLLKGRVDHRGTALTEDEKAGEMLSCVSRGVGHIVVGLPDV
jgi:MOSC domain-containing protein YiiM/ferredoxin-NADP reductase